MRVRCACGACAVQVRCKCGARAVRCGACAVRARCVCIACAMRARCVAVRVRCARAVACGACAVHVRCMCGASHHHHHHHQHHVPLAGATNLSQGFPDEPPPREMVLAAAGALLDGASLESAAAMAATLERLVELPEPGASKDMLNQARVPLCLEPNPAPRASLAKLPASTDAAPAPPASAALLLSPLGRLCDTLGRRRAVQLPLRNATAPLRHRRLLRRVLPRLTRGRRRQPHRCAAGRV